MTPDRLRVVVAAPLKEHDAERIVELEPASTSCASPLCCRRCGTPRTSPATLRSSGLPNSSIGLRR